MDEKFEFSRDYQQNSSEFKIDKDEKRNSTLRQQNQHSKLQIDEIQHTQYIIIYLTEQKSTRTLNKLRKPIHHHATLNKLFN